MGQGNYFGVKSRVDYAVACLPLAVELSSGLGNVAAGLEIGERVFWRQFFYRLSIKTKINT